MKIRYALALAALLPILAACKADDGSTNTTAAPAEPAAAPATTEPAAPAAGTEGAAPADAARAFAQRTKIPGTPALIINGQYLVRGDSFDDQLRIASALIAQGRAARGR